MCSSDFFLGLLAILFPPLPVWVKRGICSADSIINITLCIFGFIPGLIHAWYIIMKYPEQYDSFAVAQEGHSTHGGHYYPAQPQGQHHPSYPNRTGGALVSAGARQPQKYSQHEQQTPPETPAFGPGEGSSGMQHGEPPSYASVVKGDHKVQTLD
ncbi:UPF0057-domain-containing protein [Morchella conica CCBAS932]|uniref:UPF0057-domain-containing protein n=1 Tax=Morchella conica CCBAS932 TaxID=1392247 RepID=A0A3N4KHB6_9PEZI|nr:UPF0057-domain-containing protein [Morchella conica CCBAS932]